MPADIDRPQECKVSRHCPPFSLARPLLRGGRIQLLDLAEVIGAMPQQDHAGSCYILVPFLALANKVQDFLIPRPQFCAQFAPSGWIDALVFPTPRPVGLRRFP